MPFIKTRSLWGSFFVCIAVLVAIGFSSAGSSALAADACPANTHPAQSDGDFSIILLPDTQNYSEKFPQSYVSQTKWIKKQQKAMNIRFVIHLGDIVQSPTVEKEWIVADRAHRVLDGVVPYSVLPGNHDMQDRDTTLYNKYFSPQRFQGCEWYAGHRGHKNDNNYCIFKASGIEFLVLSLEYAPSAETLKWADKVLAENSDCRAIVATHSYLGRKKRTAAGDRIWENLVRKHANVFLVVCGHVGGTSLIEDTNDAGAKVMQMLVDYQGAPNGGNGWLRILRFSPSCNKIIVRDYSPLLGKYRDGQASNFSLDYKMSASGSKPAVSKDVSVTNE